MRRGSSEMSKYQSAVDILQGLVDEQKILGAHLMVNEGTEIVLSESVGWRDEERSKPVTKDTVFQLASMTKPVTTIAALQLVERGLIDLAAPIGTYLPEYADGDKADVRIRHLLNHSCGLGMLMHQGMVQAMMLSDVHNDKLADRVSRWSALVPDFAPGTAMGYSPNVGFDILGHIIELVSGETLDAYFDGHVFAPLGIRDMGFVLSEEQKARKSALYHDPTEPPVVTPGDFGDLDDYIDASLSGYLSGAAGLFGTADSYNRIVRTLANQGELDGARILDDQSVRLMGTPSDYLPMSPESLTIPGVTWGLGVKVFGEPEVTGYAVPAGSYCWSGAYGTHFFVEPAINQSFTLMLNSDNLGGSESYVSRMVERALFDANLGA